MRHNEQIVQFAVNPVFRGWSNPDAKAPQVLVQTYVKDHGEKATEVAQQHYSRVCASIRRSFIFFGDPVLLAKATAKGIESPDQLDPEDKQRYDAYAEMLKFERSCLEKATGSQSVDTRQLFAALKDELKDHFGSLASGEEELDLEAFGKILEAEAGEPNNLATAKQEASGTPSTASDDPFVAELEAMISRHRAQKNR